MQKAILSIFATFVSCIGFCNQNCISEHNRQIESTYKKLYIDSEKIHIVDGKILLHANHEVMGVGALFADEQGIYLRVPLIDSWWRCICGWEYPDNVSKCVNPNCILSR